MNCCEKIKKPYLMTAGVLAPAFLLTAAHIAYHKRANLKMSDLLIFATVSVVAGFITARMLEGTESPITTKKE